MRANTRLAIGICRSTTAIGRDDAAAGLDSDLYVSFSTLANFGRSTGLPLRKKNCLSVAARPEPIAAFDTYLHTTHEMHSQT